MFEQLPPTVFIALGTIAAALISGTVAFLNLIISKEQSVSEFRQKWIDSLREELADFLSSCESMGVQAQLLANKAQKAEVTVEEIAERMQRFAAKASATYYRILMRLNPSEHTELIKKVKNVEEALSDPNIMSNVKCYGNLCAQVNEEAHSVLKKEWSRVKSGENIYRIIKIVSGVFTIITIILAVFVVANYV